MSKKNLLVSKKIKKGWKLLLRVKKILEIKGIPYWLESGTLLGFYRENRILPFTKNLNIGIPSSYMEKLIKLEHLFWPQYRFSVRYDVSGRQWLKDRYSHILIRPLFKGQTSSFFLKISSKEIGDKETRWVESRICKYVNSIHFHHLQSLTLYGETFPIPQNPEEYLSHRYRNWKTEIKIWNTLFDDQAIIKKERLEKLPFKTRWTRKKKYIKPLRMEGYTLKKAKRMITNIVKILEKNNIRYWIDMGTLLGIIRDGDLIPWDHDVDIAIDGADAEKLLNITQNFSPRYRIRSTYDHTGRLPGKLRSFRIKPLTEKLSLLYGKKELHLDIYIKYKLKNAYYWIDSFTLKKVASKYYDTLDTITWNNRSFKIPSNVEDYLSARYGDWRIPVKKFDSSMDDLAKAD
jgi:phosphorylcholine metabolism protein LicD